MENTLSPASLLSYWDVAQPLSTFLEDLLATPIPPNPTGMDPFIAINQQRVKRIRKTVQLTDATRIAVGAMPGGLKWLVINEHWCGDGAQILPVVEAVQQAAGGKVEVRALFRDQNLEVMDAFLTNGARGIPKVVGMDAEGRVYGTFGPRPEEASDLVKEIKADPERAHTYSEALHKWYAADKQQAIQRELVRDLVAAAVV
jgi:thiol-disulfide isomerase/thioredoxin